ncbi:MAG: FAD-binding oxidoreductase [Anaerolineae bacterium]|nr:FAD-binding oxidoreductase [Anaerolineae bacterium]
MDAHIIENLAQIVGADHISTADAERRLHGKDQSPHQLSLPEVVVWPETTGQVSQIAKLANAHRLAITGWGAGSSLEGNSIPLKGGIVIDFGRMNNIVTVHENDFQVTVQPGIFYKDMNKRLARYGLFFAPDPGANASIGGMVANNAAGTRTVRYGATRDNILALEVVLANGEVIRTGSRSVKQSAGYDLTHLFTGSEGTLGLITEATLKLHPLPEHFSAALATFEAATDAADAVYGIIGSGLNPAALELLDAAAVGYMNTLETVDLPEKPTLLMEFHGATETSMLTELELVKEICQETGCTHFQSGVGRDERNRLWEGRHALGEILFRIHPESNYLITDVSVPISEYPVLAGYTNGLFAELEVMGTMFGHAGDGNLHTTTFAPKDDPAKQAVLQHFNDLVVKRAIELGGTCTGEHGVGIGKQKYMVYEHGEGAVEVMRQLKALFDPNGILNPGKVVSF